MVFTFRRLSTDGAPRFRVMAGAADLGTISNPGPAAEGGAWHGLAPDGARFATSSKAKLAELLSQHARNRRSS